MKKNRHSRTHSPRRSFLLSICLVVAFAAGTLAAPPEQTARQMLSSAGTHGGLVVHVGCSDGRLTAELGATSDCVVQGLGSKRKLLRQARRRIRKRGLYGRVSARRWDGGPLPYTDNLVNVLVVDTDSVTKRQIMRVLAPRGMAFVKKDDGWKKLTKPRPTEMDEWTHYLHGADNNAVAQDEMVGPPRHLQWKARPLWCRSHETDSSISSMVSAGGRIFYILDEGPTGLKGPRFPPNWSLVARDAFSGVLLWKKPLPDWGWRQWQRSWQNKDWTETRGGRLVAPKTLQRRLVARGDRVYVTLGYREPASVLSARTGALLKKLDETDAAEEILCPGDTLVARVVPSPDNGGFRGVTAVNPATGEVLWKKSADRVTAMTLAASGGRVVFHDSRRLVCLSLATGKELWQQKAQIRPRRTTVVVRNEVVLFLTPGALKAYSARDGSRLWQAPGLSGPAVANPPDLFVIDETVWYGGPKQHFPARDGYKNLLPEGPVDTHLDKVGRNLRTGKAEKRITATNAFSSGHHFRCYRSKATERFLLWPKRGIEYIGVDGQDIVRCDWVRGPCMLGIMPANGLTYAPPHQCFCYPAAKLNGFNALESSLKFQSSDQPGHPRQEGPVFGEIEDDVRARAGDWPEFRHDGRRSGSAECTVSARLEPRWTRDVGGTLSQPVMARGRLYIADVDAHAIRCLDADDGSTLWQYTAGGRIDSPPTFYRGRLLFGSADGWIYCLRASDGRLAWRFRPAPADRQVMDFNQLESAWPAHGSVLVRDGVAYCTAGRSSYLDGGIRVFGLDVETGKKLHDTTLELPNARSAEQKGRPHDMPGVRSEVLVAGKNDHIFLRQVEFNAALERQKTPRVTKLGDRRMGRHLFSTSSLLDRTWWDRAFWWHSGRWPGFYFAMNAPKTGQILVFDDERTYGAKVFRKRNVHSPLFRPGKDKVLIYADHNDATYALSEQARNWDKGPGFHREEKAIWKQEVNVLARGMALAEDKLFVAGPPNAMPEGDRLAALEGRMGGRLFVFSAADGKKLSTQKLDVTPAFDGLIAAQGRLYMSTMSGRVVCLGAAGKSRRTAGISGPKGNKQSGTW